MAQPNPQTGPFGLSADDVRWLKALKAKTSGDRYNTPTSHQQEPNLQAPDTYVVKTPHSGVPGLGVYTTGTGTGGHDKAGSADNVKIYSVDSITSVLTEQNFTVTVWNYGAFVDGDTYVAVTRDKYGKWWILHGSPTLYHGRIIEPCNGQCSTYRVLLLHRTLLAPCDTGTGTGTGTHH
jgi:hypothetical protein